MFQIEDVHVFRKWISLYCTVGSMMCVINAVRDAIGVTRFEMPATPERVRAALNQRRET